MKYFSTAIALVFVLGSASICNAGPFDGLKDKAIGLVKDQGKKQLLKTLAKQLGEGAPIVSSADAVFATTNALPGAPFAPTRRAQSVAWQTASSPNGSVLMEPGDYSFPVTLYCMKHSASSPGGHRYLLAPLKGKRAKAIGALNARAATSRLPYSTVQALSWNLQAGRQYEELAGDQRQIVDALLPDYKATLGRNQLEEAIATYNKFAPKAGLPEFEQALAQGMLGDVGKNFLQIRQFQNVLANATNYDSLVRTLIPPAPYNGKGGAENTPWSRVSPLIYGRIFTSGSAGSTGQLQLRVLSGTPNRRRAEDGVQSTRGFCPAAVDDRIEVPLTSLVGDPQNEGIQPLSMVPNPANPNRASVACPSNALLDGKTPEQKERLRQLYHEALGVQERLRVRRENFLNTLNPEDVFPTFYYHTTSNALDLINEGTLLHPEVALDQIIAFYSAYEFNANPAKRENHWKPYYDKADKLKAQGPDAMSSWDIVGPPNGLMLLGADAHINSDLPRALDEVLNNPAYKGFPISELEDDFKQFNTLFMPTSEEGFQDVSDVYHKAQPNSPVISDNLPLRDTVGNWIAKGNRTKAWEKAREHDLPTGTAPQPPANHSALESQGKLLCP